MRRITTLLIALLRAAGISWLTIAPLAWIMRDGMGPDSVTSEGLKAVQRAFTTFNYGPIAIALLLANLLVQRRIKGTDKGSLSFAMIGIFTVIILATAMTVLFD
jgi:hypothetical protein